MRERTSIENKQITTAFRGRKKPHPLMRNISHQKAEMNIKLETLLDLIHEALLEEDKDLNRSFRNNSCYTENSGGILAVNNERYYQFAIVKYLFKTFHYRVSIEQDYVDLVVYEDNDEQNIEIAVEMKRWMSSTGEAEVPNIQRDIEKLRKSNAKKGLLLIFSANPPDVSINENLVWLSIRLNKSILSKEWSVRCFPTHGMNSENMTFWIAGYEIKK